MSKVKFESSVLQQAVNGNKEAITKMFQSFLGKEEQILDVRYFGSHGILFNKTRSFVCLTDKRIATIQYGSFNRICYQDAFIEGVNSGIIYQPSVFGLYLISILLACTIFGIILIPSWIQLFYTFNKSGMVWSIREGFSIYAFANISKINEVNSFWHHVAEVRTLRVLYLKK